MTNEYFPIEFLVLPLLAAVLIVAMCVAYLERSRREKHRVELQKAVLERVGSVKDFAEFMATEQGERFLAALAPSHFRPHDQGLWWVRIGIVMLTIGLLVMITSHSFRTFGDTPPGAIFFGTLLLVGAGLGMLLSAAVSFVIARALGVNGHSRSRKNDAA